MALMAVACRRASQGHSFGSSYAEISRTLGASGMRLFPRCDGESLAVVNTNLISWQQEVSVFSQI